MPVNEALTAKGRQQSCGERINMRSDLEPVRTKYSCHKSVQHPKGVFLFIKASAKCIDINIGRLRYLFGPNYGSYNIYN